MKLREWHFILEVLGKVRDWLDNWIQIDHSKYELEPFDVHLDENLNLVCLVKIKSCNSELDNLLFRGEDLREGVKLTVLQMFDVTE